MPSEIVILCPLEIERRAAATVEAGRARVVRTGPGAAAVARAVASLDADRAGLVVLFGVAGGLADTLIAVIAAEVLDGGTGDRWKPTLAGEAGVVVVGVETPVDTAVDKRVLHERTGAVVVDCESHDFARACVERGVRWAVVRGVSDGPDRALPLGVSGWVRDDGRTDAWRVAAGLLRRPGITPSVVRLGRATREALRAAGALLDRIIEDETRRVNSR